ncbi:AGC/PKA protein kinase [Salpingoeca rosetta]|uniref:AGC/PKA protein kinase n=1 Tax=Salpingoeca rosetta (strain ATCC 50818 / BSB-021) TaxID=946362 RepID=F2U6W1_SALR5|nr:AGC/PKA protein kinase [Salpingoeca rosetta]EGD83593.1 AGC/PKA protein kinase [Salpingoeca rosetta]|eukprot:XP_004995097.1 AGC/PKA protein kinase [Salpingoeca rosetta]
MFAKRRAKKEGSSKMKGDLEIRPYRRATKESRKKKERAAFEARLKKLASGYVSEKTLHDFSISRTLGTGSFGRVLLAQSKDKSGNVVRDDYKAVKIINKDRVIKTRQVEHTINEKNILFCIDCRFVVTLYDYFQDVKCLYFVLEFVNGGEMFTHIQKQRKRRFSEEQTRFFAAETVLAFEYLHNLDVIFRDLKPENMLIDHRGHIRVTDFGFAKRVEDKTWTMCGTPEYLAPEIIVNKGYSHAVDWWAVGVLTYEMRCGRSPFESRSQMEMFKRITKRDFKFPSGFTDNEKSFINGLLQVDLTRRLGNMHAGVDDIKGHPYFAKIDWDSLYSQTAISPYIPKVTGPGDCRNFDTYPEEPVRWHGQGTDKFGDTFVGF